MTGALATASSIPAGAELIGAEGAIFLLSE